MIRRARVEDAEILAALALQMWKDHDPEDMAKEFRELVMIHMAPGSEEANRIICFRKDI